jgi:hypothetical protein
VPHAPRTALGLLQFIDFAHGTLNMKTYTVITWAKFFILSSDIDVVGGLGDSDTAAYLAKGLAQDERGVSWSMGSEFPIISQLLTLPS